MPSFFTQGSLHPHMPAVTRYLHACSHIPAVTKYLQVNFRLPFNSLGVRLDYRVCIHYYLCSRELVVAVVVGGCGCHGNGSYGRVLPAQSRDPEFNSQ